MYSINKRLTEACSGVCECLWCLMWDPRQGVGFDLQTPWGQWQWLVGRNHTHVRN